jgi:hypothetical protein
MYKLKDALENDSWNNAPLKLCVYDKFIENIKDYIEKLRDDYQINVEVWTLDALEMIHWALCY